MAAEHIPFLDPHVEYVGASKLRVLNSTALRELKNSLVIQEPETNQPLAIIIPYQTYLELQRALERAYELVACLQAAGPTVGL